MVRFEPREIALLRPLAEVYPSADAAVAEIAHLRGILTLPKGTVHVVSDVHGEDAKLRHVINNASGSLRPLLEQLFAGQLAAGEIQTLLNTIYYPSETFAHLELEGGRSPEREAFVRETLRHQFAILREIARRHTLELVEEMVPAAYHKVFFELLWESRTGARSGLVDAMIESLSHHGRDLAAVRRASRLIRNLSVYELVVAGDLGDRGPRLDRVADLMMQQPRVLFTWGNHDVIWLGACLGHRALIATVLRISLRYQRLAQLEEGYAISMAPLERLAREVYGDDPAERFKLKGGAGHATWREPALMRRMQKAISVIQLKLEEQLVRRNPAYAMDDRALMSKIDLGRGTVDIAGVHHELADTFLPTVDPADPAALSDAEAACVEALRDAFLASPKLWRHVNHWTQIGSTYLVRDDHLIFHGCVPVDEDGEMLELEIDGEPRRGRAMFDALDVVIRRSLSGRRLADLDMLWYLWMGPRSPLFGKHAMTTFERYFIADRKTHTEHKNPYFKRIHEPEFCARVLADFGADPDSGLIVNGHVPVKIERDELPLKASRKAITIDGAFSEAYGDRGYTLILDSEGTRLAEHHHFESIEHALSEGADIIPTVRPVTEFATPRTVADTELAAEIGGKIEALERLIEAYRANVFIEED
jgi:fructose-1,6-bisphosphatase-3